MRGEGGSIGKINILTVALKKSIVETYGGRVHLIRQHNL